MANFSSNGAGDVLPLSVLNWSFTRPSNRQNHHGHTVSISPVLKPSSSKTVISGLL
jgi:hypothetical protein